MDSRIAIRYPAITVVGWILFLTSSFSPFHLLLICLLSIHEPWVSCCSLAPWKTSQPYLTSVPSFLWVPSMILRSFLLLVLWMISMHELLRSSLLLLLWMISIHEPWVSCCSLAPWMTSQPYPISVPSFLLVPSMILIHELLRPFHLLLICLLSIHEPWVSCCSLAPWKTSQPYLTSVPSFLWVPSMILRSFLLLV